MSGISDGQEPMTPTVIDDDKGGPMDIEAPNELCEFDEN